MLNAEQLESTIKRLELMREAKVREARPADDGNLIPLLTASAEVCALDVCLRLLTRELKEVAQ